VTGVDAVRAETQCVIRRMRIDNIVAGISATIRLPSFVLTKRAKLKVENLRRVFRLDRAG
jgi:hypothetical protein